MNKNNKKGLYEKVNIDNQIYFNEVNTKLNEIILSNSYDKSNNYKKNILIVGNSHAMDMFLMFKINSESKIVCGNEKHNFFEQSLK